MVPGAAHKAYDRPVRFSVGGGIGPFRVSQRIGLPRARRSSRPGYFAQFETCTVNHRSAATQARCGKRHPSPAATARSEREARSTAMRKHALERCRNGTATVADYGLVVENYKRAMRRDVLWGLLWGVLAAIYGRPYPATLYFFAPAALLCLVALIFDFTAAARVPPPAELLEDTDRPGETPPAS